MPIYSGSFADDLTARLQRVSLRKRAADGPPVVNVQTQPQSMYIGMLPTVGCKECVDVRLTAQCCVYVIAETCVIICV